MPSGRVVSAIDGTALEGVTVSNGQVVVATDGSGMFVLEPSGPFVFVSTPTGWSCDDWFRASSDGTDLVFSMEPQRQATPFSFVHISDVHVTAHEVDEAEGPATRMANLTEPGEVAAFLDEVADGNVAFVAATGDLTNHGLSEELAAFRRVVDRSPVRVVVAPGNHDHMNGRHEFRLSRHDYLVNEADTAGYEAAFGPRWYSFDYADIHFVILDWHTHELGLDNDIQDAWLAADLDRLDPEQPWVLLAHDQFASSFFDRLRRPPIATFSGHWHTSRVVDVAGTRHVNTPNTFFAALDYSPPSVRTATIDGVAVQLTTTTRVAAPRSAAPAAEVVWDRPVAGSVLRAAPVMADGRVVIASYDDDHARGALTALDSATGEVCWAVGDLPPLKASPIVVGGVVVVLDVLGDLYCVALDDGASRWSDTTDDPLRHWGYTTPTTDGSRVFAGDQRSFRAVDVVTGERTWLRDDLTFHMNLVSHASPVVCRDTVIVGFWPLPPSLQALRLEDGSVVVATASLASSVAGGFGGPSPVGSPLLSRDATLLFVPSGAGTFALDAATLATRWHTPAGGLYNPATPVETAHGLAVVIAEEGLRMLDRETGAIRWTIGVDVEAGPFACYGRNGHALLSEPAVLDDDRLLLAALDGSLHLVRASDGTVLATTAVDGTITAAPVVVDGDAVVVTTDGTVRRIGGLATI